LVAVISKKPMILSLNPPNDLRSLILKLYYLSFSMPLDLIIQAVALSLNLLVSSKEIL